MWNSIKSVQLSLVCTKIVIVLVIACAVAMPFMIQRYMWLLDVEIQALYPFMALMYIACIPAMTALICLHKLLQNIKQEQIFIASNVKFLRIISWCCFFAAAVLAVSGIYQLIFFLVAIAFGFFGLILRVVKNVIEEAMRIKDENELTI